ncbi:CHAT domain-containing protein [Streptomyces globisporus]|uniref:CHAT domain-containing protein n=1 Tax=Streptomyces globisporus TaxID=1908 RepID=UPI0036C5058E
MESAVFGELLDALHRRLAAADGDVSVLFDEFAADEADQLAAVVANGGSSAVSPLAQFHWRRFAAVGERGLAELCSAIRLTSRMSPEAGERVPLPLRVLARIDPDAAGTLEDWHRYAVEQLNSDPGQPQALDESIAVLTIVDILATDELGTRALIALTEGLFRRLDVSSDPAHLDQAISVGTRATTTLAADHAHQWILRSNLALVLRRRFRAAGDPDDLDTAIDLGREAARLYPSSAVTYSGIAIALHARHSLTGAPADLAEALEHARRAAGLFSDDDPEQAVAQLSLARLLLTRAAETGSAPDLDEAHCLAEGVTDLPEALWPSNTLDVLADVHTHRFVLSRTLPHLLELDRTLRRLLDRGHPGTVPARLADALIARFELTGETCHLDEAVTLWRGLAADAGTTAARRPYERALASVLHRRAEATGSTVDLVDGIMGWARAVAKEPGAERIELAPIRGRLHAYGATGNTSLLLDPAAEFEAARVVERDHLAYDLEARTLAGWLLCIRASHSGAHAEEELIRAADVLDPVYLVAPEALPGLIAALFEESETDVTGRGDLERRHNTAGLLRLDLYFDTGSAFALRGAVEELRQAARTSTGDEQRAAACNNLALALAQLALSGNDHEAMVEAAAAARLSVELSAPDAPYLPGRLALLCGVLSDLGTKDADPELIQEARQAGERGVSLTPADHPSRGLHMAQLCTALVADSTHTGDTARLREAISRFEDALPLLPPGHRHHVSVRLRFATALDALATATASTAPLHRAEQVLRETLPTAQGLPRLAVLDSLMSTLSRLHSTTAEPSPSPFLLDAVATGRELIAGTPETNPQLLPWLREVAVLCAQLFARTNDAEILDEGITLMRRAWSHPEPEDPDGRGSRILTNLLRWKAEDTGDVSFLEEADRVSRQAVRLRPQGAEYLADRAHVLMNLHRMTGRLGALRSAIAAGHAALERTAADDPEREERGARLIDGLRSLHELTGEPEARETGIALARAEAARDPRPEAYWWFALAMMYSLRPAGTDEATEILRRYLAAIPADHQERSRATHSLGHIHLLRYQHTGALAFLQEAIALFRACEDTPGTQNSLAQALYVLHRRSGDPAALVEAVEVGRDLVVSASARSPYRSLHLGNFADYLASYARLAGDTELLRMSVDVCRAAVVAAGSDRAARATNLHRLTSALLAQARQDGERGLVAQAVDAGRLAVRLAGGEHAASVAHAVALGRALIRHGVTEGDKAALAEARDVLSRAAVQAGAALADRITASQEWAAAAMHLEDPEEAMGAYRHGVSLLVERAGPALAWADREFGMSAVAELPGHAAAAAIAAGHLDTAVALLEQSRGVLLAEALHARIDLPALAEHAPRLAEDFRRVSGELRALDLPRSAVASGGPTPAWVAERRLELGREWRRVCARVRRTPGFEGFLLPPTPSEVGEATQGGTVVIVNVSTWRCDALVMTGGTVELVALPGLSATDCLARANHYLMAVQGLQNAVQTLATARKEAHVGAGAAAYQAYHAAKLAAKEARSAVENTLAAILVWLWDTVAGPVVEHVKPDGSSLPRLWWCPTGPLTMLPLHAAGHPGDQGRSLPDRAVSSYVPTLRALVNAHRSPGPGPGDGPRMLVVVLPRTPGRTPLPHAARERDHLVSLFPPPASTVLSDDDATCDGAMEALAHHRWVHFSCHGEQVLDAPADSRLLLADGPLTVARLIEHMPSGEFAFLSACQTASSGLTLLDEVITPASALHYAGYRHVVATLWPVLDTVAADLTEATYDALTAGGRFEPSGAARALHTAVGVLRARYADQPSVWAAYVHIGV